MGLVGSRGGLPERAHGVDDAAEARARGGGEGEEAVAEGLEVGANLGLSCRDVGQVHLAERDNLWPYRERGRELGDLIHEGFEVGDGVATGLVEKIGIEDLDESTDLSAADGDIVYMSFASPAAKDRAPALLDSAPWRTLSANRDNRVFVVNNEVWQTGQGLVAARGIVEDLRWLNAPIN